ncbi:MAG: hypothetical protein RLZZ175_2299 [Bacteroidota bacterium]|jgi:hypothetical protein
MENISKHITYQQGTYNKHGVDNTPNETQLSNMKYLGSYFDIMYEAMMLKVKKGLKKFLYITCMFRGKKVNSLTAGASKTSLHLNGEAIDIDAVDGSGITNKMIFDYIKDNLPFTELIWEFGTSYPNGNPSWVHYGLVKGRENEKVIKIATKVQKKDAKGNLLKDKAGNPIYTTIYTRL